MPREARESCTMYIYATPLHNKRHFAINILATSSITIPFIQLDKQEKQNNSEISFLQKTASKMEEQ